MDMIAQEKNKNLFYLYLGIIFICAHIFSVVASASDYTLGTGDIIKITVYEHRDLTSETRIDGEGNINLPLIGKIHVASLTVTEASDKISQLLSEGYIVNPQVTLSIAEYGSKKAVILGQVVKPGLYEIRENMTLLELISQAGGLKNDAGNMAIIKRSNKFLGLNDNTVINIDLKELIEKGQTSLNIPIVEGDSIYISKAKTFFVTGEVAKPGEYKFEENITVIKAITLAGGLTSKASAVQIKIIRQIDKKETVLSKVSMDKHILPDDVIIVPESFF